MRGGRSRASAIAAPPLTFRLRPEVRPSAESRLPRLGSPSADASLSIVVASSSAEEGSPVVISFGGSLLTERPLFSSASILVASISRHALTASLRTWSTRFLLTWPMPTPLLTHHAQFHCPLGTHFCGGRMHSRWNTREHVSHKMSSPPAVQTAHVF